MAYKVKSTGRWVAQARDPQGRRIQLGTYATRREAKDEETRYARRRPQGDVTVSEWRAHWLTNPAWKESTRAHNTERTAAFERTYGQTKLVAVNRTIARAFLADHAAAHGALSAMFGAAMYADDEHGNPLLTANPFSKLVKRTVRRRDLRSEWLTAEDVDELEVAARSLFDPRWAPTAAGMVRFAAETGVRPGELFVLELGDLYDADGMVRISKAADSKTRRVGPPKNGEVREIVLSTRAYQAATAAGGVGTRVFSSPTGCQFWNSSWLYYWKQIRAAAGRPGMDFYELRHYCATRLLEAGLTERDVAEQLGHTDGGELVRQVYGHPSKRKSLARVRAALDS
jgi:Site-specific recombinase XerD